MSTGGDQQDKFCLAQILCWLPCSGSLFCLSSSSSLQQQSVGLICKLLSPTASKSNLQALQVSPMGSPFGQDSWVKRAYWPLTGLGLAPLSTLSLSSMWSQNCAGVSSSFSMTPVLGSKKSSGAAAANARAGVGAVLVLVLVLLLLLLPLLLATATLI